MYSAMPINAGMPMPGTPLNFCAGPVYGNVPFQQSFPPTPFYPPVCNNYKPNTTSVHSSVNPDRNLPPQLQSFNRPDQMPLFSQPPPGYSADGQCIPHNHHCNTAPHFQPIHMSNVRSSPYPGFCVPNSLPINNQFTCPPPPMHNVSNSQQQGNNMKRNFSVYKNNRKMKDAKEKSLKKPWVNETLKTEIEKKFTLLEEAKTKNEPSAWDAYLEQKKLVDDINQALRLEYLGNHPDTEFPYYCETCDRGFLSMSKFTEHKSEHITCGKQGCSFTAHPKVVEKHFMMQHRTGLFNRIVKGNSPEEIQKWITERKKHFPTKEKIEEKQAQRVEMEKRGERYAERKKSFNQRNSNFKSGANNRFNQNMGNKQPPHKFKTFGRRGTFAKNKNTDEGSESQPRRREPITTEEDGVVRNLPPFKGTAYYLNLETTSEMGDSVITDEDNFSVMSANSDDCSDFANDCEGGVSGESIIAEIEKNSNEFTHEPNASCGIDLEEDCLDKHFKSSDIPTKDIVIPCDDKLKNVDDVTIADFNSLAIPSVNDANVIFPRINTAPLVDPPITAEKPLQNVNSSLALIQCYDSEDNSEEDDIADTTDCTQSSAIKEPPKKDDDEESEPEECSSKPLERLEEIKNELVNNNESSEKFDDEKPNDNKKRKRRRRRDSKSEEEDATNAEKVVPEDKTRPTFQTRKRYRPPTLLEKLLAQEIKHERNAILQCVRYVVQNNYFNIGSSK